MKRSLLFKIKRIQLFDIHFLNIDCCQQPTGKLFRVNRLNVVSGNSRETLRIAMRLRTWLFFTITDYFIN